MVREQNSRRISLELSPTIFEQVSFRANTILQLDFKQNGNLLLNSKLSKIPLQKSSYTALLPHSTYEPYTVVYQLNSNHSLRESYQVFGHIIVGFLLVVAMGLLLYNWFAKVYESMHLLQLIFLLATLELSYPPNLYYFLQGFRGAHFYLVANWFV